MKAYICDKSTSSVNDVKCSNVVASECMNEVYDIIEVCRGCREDYVIFEIRNYQRIKLSKQSQSYARCTDKN